MPVVTALEAHRRNRERVKLFLDDEYVMDLPLATAADLRRGQCLTSAEIEDLADAGALQWAYDTAVRFLAYRPRSAEEVRRRLARERVPATLQSAVVERLLQRGYLDDVAFARFWRENRERFKPLAPRALRYELRQKGIAEDIIDSQLAPMDVGAAAYRAAEARARRYRGGTRQRFREELGALLRRRGFDTETIREVVRRLQQDLENADNGYFRDEAAD